jgi:hypothetical protein
VGRPGTAGDTVHLPGAERTGTGPRTPAETPTARPKATATGHPRIDTVDSDVPEHL